MEEKQYSQEEVRGKIKKYSIKRNVSLLVAGAGFISTLYLPIDNFITLHYKEPPAIVERYDGAERTLDYLKTERENSINFERKFKNEQYENKEVEEFVNGEMSRLKEKTFILDRTIKSVEQDISKMKSNTELTNYIYSRTLRGLKITGFMATSLLVFCAGLLSSAKFDRKIRKLEQKSK